MPPSFATTSTNYPSLTSETSSIVSSELPRTASENNHPNHHSPSPWRAPAPVTTDTDKDHSDRSLPPRFAKRFFRLVGTSNHHHTLSAPTNAVELSAYAQRQAAEIESGRAQAPRKPRTREEAATSWGTTSLASAASTTGLASKHSSLGPLPIFPRPPVHSFTRHAQVQHIPLDQELNNPVVEERSDAIGPEPSHPHHHPIELPPSRSATPSRTIKSRPTLASLFQSAGRKALRRDQFRKDSFRGDNGKHQEEPMMVSQSVPSTPLRRRFLGLMSSAGDTVRAAKSTPPPPPMPVPNISLPTNFKGKEPATPSTPILRRKRSSLPNPPRSDHGHHEHLPEPFIAPPSHDYLDPNQFTLRRSKSDSKHGKRSHSPGHTLAATSIRVPGPPPDHHPHPHPYFPCDTPLDRGLLSLPSFSFERPVTRPSTPGQSQEFLPIDHTRRYKARAPDMDSDMTAEIKSVLAAGTEARRERRAPSRERLRVIGPMHRQNLPDVTGGDEELSPDPGDRFSQPVSIPAASRSRSHLAHGLFAFESPASTPYGSRIDLPPTPPPSKPRKITPPMPVQPQPQPRSHHRHFSSSATAVSPPAPTPPPKDAEWGLRKGFGSPRLFAGNKPHQEQRTGSYDKHRNSPSQARHASLDSARESAKSPSSYRHQHSAHGHGHNHSHSNSNSYGHSHGHPHAHSHGHGHGHGHSLSGSTVQNHYLTPAQSPAGLAISLYPTTREERFYDLRDAMRLSIGESRYKSFERAIRKYNERSIPMHGHGGLFERVQRLLNDAVADGLPSQTALRYFQTFQTILTEVPP